MSARRRFFLHHREGEGLQLFTFFFSRDKVWFRNEEGIINPARFVNSIYEAMNGWAVGRRGRWFSGDCFCFLTPLRHWTLSDHHCAAGWQQFDSLPRSLLAILISSSCGGTVNSTEHVLLPTSSGPKWFEPSDWRFTTALSWAHRITYFMAGHWGGEAPPPQRGRDHWKLPYFNGFTASNLCPPPYCRLYSIEVSHRSSHHFLQRPGGGAVSPRLFCSPPPTFTELSSKCYSVCYKSSNSSLCLRVVAFCAETTWWKFVAFLLLKRKRIWTSLEWFPFGCFLTSPPSASDELLPSVHPSVWHPSINHQRRHRTGIINLDYLKKRWRAVVLRCSEWRRRWGSHV